MSSGWFQVSTLGKREEEETLFWGGFQLAFAGNTKKTYDRLSD